MVYCKRDDSTGACILPIVYASMLLGNVAYIYLVFYPALKQFTEHD